MYQHCTHSITIHTCTFVPAVKCMFITIVHSRQVVTYAITRVETNIGTAPTVWNLESVRLSGNIITFCCHLKTYLINLAYPP